MTQELLTEAYAALEIRARSLHYAGSADLVERLILALEQKHRQVERLRRVVDQAFACDGTCTSKDGWTRLEYRDRPPGKPCAKCRDAIASVFYGIDCEELLFDVAGDR